MYHTIIVIFTTIKFSISQCQLNIIMKRVTISISKEINNCLSSFKIKIKKGKKRNKELNKKFFIYTTCVYVKVKKTSH